MINDPLFEHSWHLDNITQSNHAVNGGEIGEDLNLTHVIENNIRGESIKIAVSDTGIQEDHEDLHYNIWTGGSRNYSQHSRYWHGSNSTPPVSKDPGYGHGTAVAGIIGAVGWNGVGSMGVAPFAFISGFRFLYAGSITMSKYLDQAHGNFDVFNYSYGFSGGKIRTESQAYLDQLNYGVSNLRNGRGAIYVKSSGNSYVNYDYKRVCELIAEELDCDYIPYFYYNNASFSGEHSYPYMIVTSSLNASGRASSYSTPGSSVWVSAYGGEYGVDYPAIMTTDLEGCDRGFSQSKRSPINSFEGGESSDNPNCNYTSVMNGTSAAVPMVSGSVALIIEANTDLSWRAVKHILAKTARKVDPTSNELQHPVNHSGSWERTHRQYSCEEECDLDGHIYDQGWVTNAAGYNFHNWYGFGVVDVEKAVEMAETYNEDLGTFSLWEFDSGAISYEVPDDASIGAVTSLNVDTEISIEAVQVEVTIEHTAAQDLGLELSSPSGTKSVLMNINSGILGESLDRVKLLSNAFYEEISQGEWELKVIDGKSGNTGTLTNWKLNVYGHLKNRMP